MRPVLAALLIAFAAPALAQEGTAPETSAVPPARPDPEDRQPADEPASETGDEAAEAGDLEMPPMPVLLSGSDEDFADCASRLEDFGAAFEMAEPVVADDPQCGIERPVTVTAVADGIALTPPATLRCETALAMAKWVADFVIPASRHLPERGPVVSITHASDYVCRRRNNLPDGKLSEHSFGNAIDIVAFEFESGDPIRVEPREREGTLAEAFQRAVRAGSCLTFTTVIGPGTDEAHADHLHLDIKERRGGFRLCQ